MRDEYDAVLLGGSGFIGSESSRTLVSRGATVLTLDRNAPRDRDAADWLRADLLVDDVDLPGGPVGILLGGSDLRRRHLWTLVLDTVMATARILPQLSSRPVTLVSSVEVYGPGRTSLTELTPPNLPAHDDDLRRWCDRVRRLAEEPIPPWRGAALCRELLATDPTGRWGYALAKRAQELLLLDALDEQSLRILRVSNVFGRGQHRVVARLARRAQAGLPLTVVDGVRSFVSVQHVACMVAQALSPGAKPGLRNVGTNPLALSALARIVIDELGADVPVTVLAPQASESSGEVDTVAPDGPSHGDSVATGPSQDRVEEEIRAFIRDLVTTPALPLRPPVPVVIPPRPFRPDLVSAAQQHALWSGEVKHGNRQTRALTETLSERLALEPDRRLLLTASGTAALRLAVLAAAGPTRPGAVAVLPSFTFPATGEVLVQLGYRLRFCDVDPETWTTSPTSLADALAPGDVQVVVVVDTFGNPCAYDDVVNICHSQGVPVVGDSAPALGAAYTGRPVGTQADAHAFSMSFAKVVSAGGAGGAVVLPVAAVSELGSGPNWLRSSMMTEVAAAAAVDLVEGLDQLLLARHQVADTYAELLGARDDVTTQRSTPGSRHAWVHWTLAIEGAVGSRSRRDEVAARLGELGIGTKPYYSPLLHTMSWPARPGPGRADPSGGIGHPDGSDAVPISVWLESRALAVPMSSELSLETAEQVAVRIARVLDDCPASDDVEPVQLTAVR